MSPERDELLMMMRGLLHEFANGLTIVEGTVDALDHEMDAEIQKELSEDLSEISGDLCRLMDRIRAAAGLGALQLEHQSLSALLKEASKRADITPPPSIEGGQGSETVYGDKQALTQLLAELLRNAKEAASEGSVRVSMQRPDGAQVVRLTVADEGPGMDEEQLRRACQPFFSTRMRRGAGLGLAIARGVAEQHGGTLAIDSDTSGTRVTVTLPSPAPDEPTAKS